MFWSFPFLKGLSKAYLAEAAELAMYCAWTRWGSDMGTPLYFALVKQFWSDQQRCTTSTKVKMGVLKMDLGSVWPINSEHGCFWKWVIPKTIGCNTKMM
jgi:hypothetical protein